LNNETTMIFGQRFKRSRPMREPSVKLQLKRNASTLSQTKASFPHIFSVSF
jgi:hypothetical protein